MSLRHGLLGLLAEGPASGYDLARRFQEALGPVWPAQHPKIYAELARLTYDSNEDRLPAVTRAETASIRSLTFTSEHLTLELEVTGNSLLGQIFPARAGVLEIHTRAGEISTTEVDEIGCFSVEPIPASPFRLRCSASDGTHVLTGWITI